MSTATAPPTKAERSRRRILAAAAHELAAHGYGGTSLRQVAAAADLQPGSLHFHFASKDELVAAALRDGVDVGVDAVVGALALLPPDAPFAARLEAAMHAHLDALHASHDRAAAVVRMATTLPPALREAQFAYERRYTGLWRTLIEDGKQAGAIDPGLPTAMLCRVVFGGLNSTLVPADRPPDRRIVDTLLALLLGSAPRRGVSR